jgi:hypothetical protein
MTQSLVGYKLLDGNGNTLKTWGGIWGQCPSVPDVITLPNGDQVHCPVIAEPYSNGCQLVGWMMDPPAATPQTNYAAAIAAGLTIVSTATPALNGVYAVDPSVAGVNINSIIGGINANIGLPGGGSSFTYFDMSNAPHSFTQAQFLTLAQAIRDYVYALDLYLAGVGNQPAATATIP